eukprot:1158851-Pelagomonas_calceolata.AAC.2
MPRTHSRYPLRNRGGRAGNREHSAPATATSTASKVHHSSQLSSEQRHIQLVEVKYCEDTRPKNQLKASKQQHRNLCHNLSRMSAQITLHSILLGVCEVIYTPHTLEPLKVLGLDTYKATKLALKLHAHSVQCTYKLASTSLYFKTSFNSHRRDQGVLLVTLLIPIDFFLLVLLAKGIHGALALGFLFPRLLWGVLHCLRSFLFL